MEAHEVYPIEHVLASDLLTMLGVFRPESYSFPKVFGMLVYKIICDLSSDFREMYSFRDYESCLEVIARREDPNLHVELPSIINFFGLAQGVGIIEAFITLIQAGCSLDSRFAKYPITEGYLACFEEYLSSIRESTEENSRRSDAMIKLDDVISRQQKMSHQVQSVLSEVGIESTFVQDLLVFIAEVGSDLGELQPIHSSLWTDLCTLEMDPSEAAILMEKTWGIASQSKVLTPPMVLTSAVKKDKELGTTFAHLLCEFFGLVATSISALAGDRRVDASEAIEHYKRLLHDFCERVSADTGNADRSRGSKFLPDAEAVPLVTTAVVNLVIGVCIAMLWVFLRSPESKYILAVLTLAFLVIGLGGLFWTHYLMSRFGYPLPYRNWLGREKTRIKLGAPELTPEAKDIQRKTNKVTATLLQEANGILTLVFTEASIAETRSKALLSFILFQVGLTLALVCAAILLN